jgi:chromosomal replication initiation ATPase DnaA
VASALAFCQPDADAEAGERVVLSLFKGVMVVPPPKTRLTEIAELVAERYGLTVQALRGPSKVKRIAHPRQEAMTISYDTGEWSNGQIGQYYGGRDHSTVVHARKVVAKRRAKAAIAGTA